MRATRACHSRNQPQASLYSISTESIVVVIAERSFLLLIFLVVGIEVAVLSGVAVVVGVAGHVCLVRVVDLKIRQLVVRVEDNEVLVDSRRNKDLEIRWTLSFNVHSLFFFSGLSRSFLYRRLGAHLRLTQKTCYTHARTHTHTRTSA